MDILKIKVIWIWISFCLLWVNVQHYLHKWSLRFWQSWISRLLLSWMMLYSVEGRYQCFRLFTCLHLQGTEVRGWRQLDPPEHWCAFSRLCYIISQKAVILKDTQRVFISCFPFWNLIAAKHIKILYGCPSVYKFLMQGTTYTCNNFFFIVTVEKYTTSWGRLIINVRDMFSYVIFVYCIKHNCCTAIQLLVHFLLPL
jgi:hypothetical protein